MGQQGVVYKTPSSLFLQMLHSEEWEESGESGPSNMNKRERPCRSRIQNERGKEESKESSGCSFETN